MNLQSVRQPADKILCIGSSTHNKGTLIKIKEALVDTQFLESWAVIFACHRLFKLNNKNGDTFKISQELKGLKVIFIDKPEICPIEQSYVYILPDSYWMDELEQIHTRFTEQKGIPVIEATNSGKAKEEDDDWLEKLTAMGDEGIYLPCIDKIMTQLAHSQVSKIAGLLLCGMGLDGANGLLEIHARSQLTAVQMPSECSHNSRDNTDSMPKAALELHSHQEVSLEYPSRTTPLTEWLCTL